MANVISTRALKAAVLFGGMMSGLVLAAPADVDKATRKEIAERIAPVGEVCLEGQPCASAAPVVASSGPRTGDAIYNTYCTACHTAGVLGAPKKDDKAAWDTKLAAAGSYSQLLSNAIKGIGSMPPKGTCMDCSDEEISVAIEYMSGLKP
ncbi:c-type cytochrome [Parendozoicomonas haliclonae]|uniref:Cytochrome c5 n=1 Tax=Parendozoicomonas haliclonae TaxID=1960125 RepID=A0A1X7AIL5_9GAMM|nr:c-type cytochrome [Parendozoicomonas haliclonae]SMA45380.1 Cytochrome c5 [Parendozoicomonas haliclonae]